MTEYGIRLGTEWSTVSASANNPSACCRDKENGFWGGVPVGTVGE